MRSRERRRLHLLQRQLDAIHALEAQVAQPVSPADGCEAWLVDAVAARLHRARLATLGDLVHCLRTRGPGWWRPLRGIGARKARAITAFLRARGHVRRGTGPRPRGRWRRAAAGGARVQSIRAARAVHAARDPRRARRGLPLSARAVPAGGR
jgi:hypothetical protein